MEIQHKLHAEHAATCQDAAVDRLEVAQHTVQERRDQQAIIIMHQEIRVITEITIAPEALVEKHTVILIKLLAIAVNISAAAAAAHLGYWGKSCASNPGTWGNSINDCTKAVAVFAAVGISETCTRNDNHASYPGHQYEYHVIWPSVPTTCEASAGNIRICVCS